MQSVLFICTGNYYRSRTAEELFNHWATQHSLSWRADSRGLREDMSKSSNVGPMSPFALEFLDKLSIPIIGRERMPQSLVMADFQQFDTLICMDEAEHRPMMQARFPDFVEAVQYWQLQDVQFETPEVVLPRLHQKVDRLVKMLVG